MEARDDGDSSRIDTQILIIYDQDYWLDESMKANEWEWAQTDVEHVWQPRASASYGERTAEAGIVWWARAAEAWYSEHAQQRIGGLNVWKLGKQGKHHRQVRDVTIDVEWWRRIILDNQHEFPVLRNDYAWGCGICILNNQEFKPDYI